MFRTVALFFVMFLLLKVLVGELRADRREIRRLVRRERRDREEIRRLSEALRLVEDEHARLSDELSRVRDRRKLSHYFYDSFINDFFSYLSKLSIGSPDVYERQW